MPTECPKCGYYFLGDVCPHCGHDRRPKSVRIYPATCLNCKYSYEDDFYHNHYCRRFPPTIKEMGRRVYPEVDDRTIPCAEWDDGRHEQRLVRKRKE